MYIYVYKYIINDYIDMNRYEGSMGFVFRFSWLGGMP